MRYLLWVGFCNQKKSCYGNSSWSSCRTEYWRAGHSAYHAGQTLWWSCMSDVTQGLPRVEELFEMRTPKNLSPITEITGKVKIETTEDGYRIKMRGPRIKPVEEREYFIPLASTLTVSDGDEIAAGTPLAQGYLDPKEVLKISGLTLAQRYIITEVQKVYE